MATFSPAPAVPSPVPDATTTASAGREGLTGRLVQAPLWLHGLALLVALLALLVVVHPEASYSTDEGSYIIVARQLADGGGWLRANPLPAVDPSGRNYPVANSAWGTKGVSPYARHPLYVVVLAAADRVAGVTGIIGLSVAGTALASLLAGLLAERLRVGTGVLALWVTGLASPLLFDSFLAIGHTLAAATAAGAVWCALVALSPATAAIRRHSGARLAAGLGATALTAVTGMLRTEGLLFGLALAFGLVVSSPAAWRRRAAALAAGLVVAVGSAREIDAIWSRHIIGSPVADPSFRLTWEGQSYLAGRLEAFRITLLDPGYGPSAGTTLVLLGTIALVSGVVLVFRGSQRRDLGAAAAVLGAVLLALRAGLQSGGPIPGLLPAFPLLWVGAAAGAAVAVRRNGPGRIMVVALGGFLAAVLLTQYSVGGGIEWGGRYFALGMPVAVAVLAGGLVDGRNRLDRRTRRLLTGVFVVATVSLGAAGVLELHSLHERNDTLAASIQHVAEANPGRVVLVTEPVLPRLLWRHLDDSQWLLVDPLAAADHDIVARLRSAGVNSFVFVTPDYRRDAPLLNGAPSREVTAVANWAIYEVGSAS